ncbi:hypothetical protein DSO57_1032426 [Entomophthora muscae]|uniref:Uncharacterized protein n=1 Tax=Entomophthora muscae TaxID=34485 RepID=A0ACC2UA46_9FUNG|nr:hypothetical protein DSO57_1032426 [Entomophthora muscae]
MGMISVPIGSLVSGLNLSAAIHLLGGPFWDLKTNQVCGNEIQLGLFKTQALVFSLILVCVTTVLITRSYHQSQFKQLDPKPLVGFLVTSPQSVTWVVAKDRLEGVVIL